MCLLMLLASRPAPMGEFAIPPVLKALGWLATLVMAAAATGMVAS
jgi:hypothetical protein